MGVLLFLGVIVVGAIASGSDSGSSSSSNPSASGPTAEVAKSPEEAKTEYMEQIGREIASVKAFDGSKYRETKAGVQMGPVLFGAWAMLVDKSNDHKLSAGEKAKVAELRRRISAIQVRELPKMRAAWGKIMREAMWEHDLDVRTSGEANRTLKLTGAVFASNAGIKKIQETLHDQAVLLRFRRVEYRWYKGQDEYTYYTLETPPDGAIRQITENGFAPAD